MKQSFEKRINIIVSLVLIGYAVFLCFDLLNDWTAGATILHMITEGAVAVLTVALGFYLVRDGFRLRSKSQTLANRVNELEMETSDWKKRTTTYVRGLTIEINEQLASWQLSPAEKEIAMLLLKGCSNKEIAQARNTSEHTVKQQASAIYKKSGLKSRSEMGAFFLGDLLAPLEESEKPGETSH
jgi:DNA-binding NarL/FixJ family response regulator